MKKVPLLVRKNFYFYEMVLIKQKGGERGLGAIDIRSICGYIRVCLWVFEVSL